MREEGKSVIRILDLQNAWLIHHQSGHHHFPLIPLINFLVSVQVQLEVSAQQEFHLRKPDQHQQKCLTAENRHPGDKLKRLFRLETQLFELLDILRV